MFGVPLADMTPDIRSRAKAINYGIVYGISGFGLARNLRIPREEASDFIKRYFDKFPGIKDYMDATTKAFAKKPRLRRQPCSAGSVHTPGVGIERGPAAGYARRAAINAPIQGSNADIIRRAMARMDARHRGAGRDGCCCRSTTSCCSRRPRTRPSP